ncbi:MAG: exo-alpha-sialidase, partial [Acidobacteria bacterium]|nr:exo-alpha-sialidase [Acidobacteriota bacterium]
MKKSITVVLALTVLGFCYRTALQQSEAAASPTKALKPFIESEIIFPLEHWHNHASCIVECPNGDLLVCWFNGSGERQADDVKVEGARLKKGSHQWSPRFTMADTPGYPDTNCAMFIDPQGRLWLMWPTILANEWHTALMKYKISDQYQTVGAPIWKTSEVMHVTPGQEFIDVVNRTMDEWEKRSSPSPEAPRETLLAYSARIRKMAADKLLRRIGWMTRAHPFVLN